MLAYILGSILFFIQTKYYLSIIPVRRKMLRILLVSIIPTLLLIYIKQFVPVNILTLILQGILFVLVYFILILFTNCLDKNDLMIIKTIKEKII
jgi:hypothetical protein